MTRLQVRVLVVGMAVMIGVGVALFGGLIPGLKPNYSAPAVATVEGHRYYVQWVALAPPTTNPSPPWNVSIHNVTFELQLTNWYSSLGGQVRGTGTESNGTHYSFVLGQTYSNGSRATLYISPDSVFGASFPGGWFGGIGITLMVETSYAASPSTSSASDATPLAAR